MTVLSRALDTFPSVRLPSQSGGLPVEVVLIAQIGIGAGSPLIAATSALQRGHATPFWVPACAIAICSALCSGSRPFPRCQLQRWSRS